MKKNHSPLGMRHFARLPFYILCFMAVVATREQMSSGGGALSDSLGRGLNQVLLASSKLGLGFALICMEEAADDTMVGRSGRKLGKASHEAFVESSKVEIFAK